MSDEGARLALGDALLRIARGAIARQFGLGGETVVDMQALRNPAATFVTLMKRGTLRGCIGSLEPQRPLREDVERNALAAAFRDPRFPPLRAGEFGETRVEVSLLGPTRPIAFKDESDALSQLRPGIDGIVLVCGARRATFLPQVWESLPRAVDFLAHLKRKAGLPESYWGEDVKLARYEVMKWKESDTRVGTPAT